MSLRVIPFSTEEQRTAAAGEVAQHLRAGGWIAYPTETVYGIGCALLWEPLEALAAAKRPGGHRPFLLLVPQAWVAPALHWTDEALRLAEAFWPGPLTLAVSADPGAFPAEVTGEDGTVAVRRSPHPAVRAIVEALGAPITSTSANLPGEPPARDAAGAADVLRRLGGEGMGWVLDGGTLADAAPSTLVRAGQSGVEVLRAGAIPEDDVQRVLRGANGD